MKTGLAIAIAGVLLTANGARAATACPADWLSPDGAVRMQTRLFSALEHENRAAWDLLVAPDFLAFERGKPYGAGAFFDLIVSAHRAGARAHWSVTDPRVEADCNLAVMSYVNSGDVALAGGAPKPMHWLETVAFRRDPKGWRAFLVTSVVAAE